MPTSVNSLFLSLLSSKSLDLLMAHSTAIVLPVQTVLYELETIPPYAYFMTEGIASVVTTVAAGGTAEVGVIGHEGVVGSVHLLGPGRVPTRCFMQLPGSALRIPLSELRKAFHSSEEIRSRILEFVQEQVLSLSQIAACHRLHQSEERLARWLLMVQDRTLTDILRLTQEFLAQMLGSQRTTVTASAGTLQRRGSIEYRHGQVTILDRAKLESEACDCYQIMKDLYRNLYRTDSAKDSV
jgi:CRP-like cAMP-binding protein